MSPDVECYSPLVQVGRPILPCFEKRGPGRLRHRSPILLRAAPKVRDHVAKGTETASRRSLRPYLPYLGYDERHHTRIIDAVQHVDNLAPQLRPPCSGDEVIQRSGGRMMGKSSR